MAMIDDFTRKVKAFMLVFFSFLAVVNVLVLLLATIAEKEYGGNSFISKVKTIASIMIAGSIMGIIAALCTKV